MSMLSRMFQFLNSNNCSFCLNLWETEALSTSVFYILLHLVYKIPPYIFWSHVLFVTLMKGLLDCLLGPNKKYST